MPQHLSIRVPWHDNGWNGNVCVDPSSNNSCLRLKNIYENRNDVKEDNICGQCMANNEEILSCIGEGAAFMADFELVKMTVHPYKKTNPKTYGHFLPTEIIYPAYSFPERPYAWILYWENHVELFLEKCYIQHLLDRLRKLLFFITKNFIIC